MKHLNISGISLSLALPLIALGLALPSTTFADTWNQLTKVTFNQPVEIPGQVLPAGTYWFKLLNSPSDRDIVQIYNSNQSKQVALLMAVPDYRLHPTGKTIISFEERKAGTPEAIKAWFYPGDNYGQQFVYPKQRATELAKAVNQPVLSMPANLEANTRTTQNSSNQAAAMAMKKAPVKAQQPSGEESEEVTVVQIPPQLLAQNNPPAQTNNNAQSNNAQSNNTQSNNTQPATNHHRLPSTASELPLFALLGFAFVSLGLLIPVFAKRVN